MKRIATLLLAGLCACDDGGSTNSQEVITTVTLTFTPSGGNISVVASFRDPDGPGGAAPTIDPIVLTAATAYTGTVKFLNELEDPAEDITVEVGDESDQHQIFFTGTAVNGPASDHSGAPLTHVYGDQDVNGLPIGLTNSFAAVRGTGTMQVVLQHMPPLNDQPQKVAGLAEQVKTGGVDVLPGEHDVNIEFMVTVP